MLKPFRLCMAATFVAAQLVGCLGGSRPIDEALEPVTIEQRTTGLTASPLRTRDEVISTLGEPWISNRQRRVDVFRLSAEQHHVSFSLLPPLVLPGPTEKYRGYSLVSYASDGTVEGVDWAFHSKYGQVTKAYAKAGDYTFQHYGGAKKTHPTLSVSYRRYVQDLSVEPDAKERCTLFANPCHPAPDGYRRVCWKRLSVDGEDFGNVFVPNQSMVPVYLRPGSHRLTFRSRDVDGEATTSLTCGRGEIWHASLDGDIRPYSYAESLYHRSRLGKGTAQIMLSREGDPGRAPLGALDVILYIDGKSVDGRGVDSKH